VRPFAGVAPGPDRILLGPAVARFERLLPGFGEANFGIDPDGEELLLTANPVLQAPVAGSVGVHEQEEPAAIGELVGLGAGLCLADFGVGEVVTGHGSRPFRRGRALYPTPGFRYPFFYP
jgi:hypothetical protein